MDLLWCVNVIGSRALMGIVLRFKSYQGLNGIKA